MRPGDPDMIMVGHAYGPAVLRALTRIPGRKLFRSVLRVYGSLLCEIAPDTGELLCSAAELSESSGVPLGELEAVMLKLAELRVIVRDPRRGGDAWFINPHLAWAGSLEARARFAELVPPPAVEPVEAGD